MNIAIFRHYKIASIISNLVNNKALVYCLALFIITRIIYLLAWVFDVYIPNAHPVNPWFISANSILDPWCRWDSQWYLMIASEGYGFNPDSFAFLPLYPAIIRLLTYLIGSPELAGVIISNVSLIIALYYLYKLIEIKWPARIAKKSLLFLIIFPTAFYFSAIYTESLFLALVVLSFYFAEKNKYLYAGLFGILASSSRLIGLILLPCILIKYLSQRDYNLKNVDLKIIFIFLIPLGLVFYIIYQYYFAGDPLAFITAQSSDEFHRQLTIPLIAIFESLKQLIIDGRFMDNRLLNIVLLMICISILILYWKKMPLEYNIFTAFSLIIPLCTAAVDPLNSISRFVITIFPLFISLGILVKNKIQERLILVVFFISQIILIAEFVNWYWVA